MKLLNSKSILDCDEFEEEIHNKETQEILEGLLKYIIDHLTHYPHEYLFAVHLYAQ